MLEIMEKDEEDIMEDVKDIKKAISEVKKIEGFVEPEKPDVKEFDELEQKTEKIKELSGKFVENPRMIMKEVDTMKKLLMAQSRSMYIQKKLLRERQQAVVEALNSKEYKDSLLVYLEDLEKERVGAQQLMNETSNYSYVVC